MKDIIKNILNQFKISNKIKILVVSLIMNILFIFIIIIGIMYLNFEYNNKEMNLENEISDFEIDNKDTEILDKENNTIIIHIAGEVNNPGVYELKEKSRISDAIQIAGGTTNNANLEKVNLAYELQDGQKIKIPSIIISNTEEEEIITENIDEDIIEDSNTISTKININKASISDLTKLPGIGESTAMKIIEYKDKNGNFKNIDEIKNITGIGESKYNQIKDYIKVK